LRIGHGALAERCYERIEPEDGGTPCSTSPVLNRHPVGYEQSNHTPPAEEDPHDASRNRVEFARHIRQRIVPCVADHDPSTIYGRPAIVVHEKPVAHFSAARGQSGKCVGLGCCGPRRLKKFIRQRRFRRPDPFRLIRTFARLSRVGLLSPIIGSTFDEKGKDEVTQLGTPR